MYSVSLGCFGTKYTIMSSYLMSNFARNLLMFMITDELRSLCPLLKSCMAIDLDLKGMDVHAAIREEGQWFLCYLER